MFPTFVIRFMLMLLNSRLLWIQIFLLFLSLFSFWYSHYTCATFFIGVPHSLDILFYLFIFSVFVLFAFQLWRFLLRYPQAQSLSSAMSGTNKPVKCILHSVTACLISNLSFWFFLKLPSVCLQSLPFLPAVYFIH